MTLRSEARLAGCAYLGYIVFAMSSAVLSAKTMAGTDTAQKLATLARMTGAAHATVLLALLQVTCAIVLAVTLYRLSKSVDGTVAMIAMVFRISEGLLGFLPLLSRLELIQLSANTGAPGYLALGTEMLQRPDDGFSQFCFVVGGFLFACLLLTGRLIPRWLAWIGVVTIGLQMICVILNISGMLSGSVVNWLWFPILLYEVPLGFLLIFKGVRENLED